MKNDTSCPARLFDENFQTRLGDSAVAITEAKFGITPTKISPSEYKPTEKDAMAAQPFPVKPTSALASGKVVGKGRSAKKKQPIVLARCLYKAAPLPTETLKIETLYAQLLLKRGGACELHVLPELYRRYPEYFSEKGKTYKRVKDMFAAVMVQYRRNIGIPPNKMGGWLRVPVTTVEAVTFGVPLVRSRALSPVLLPVLLF